jgi:hypothetical protein
VETFVQCLQYIATGAHDSKPDVDLYLSRHAENAAVLPEGLRVCAARIARSLYTLRNKRNIAHKGDVDPNTYDLAFLHQGAAWIIAELLRTISGKSMKEAGEMVELVQAPVGTLVEEIDGTRLVFADVSIPTELLILLHSHYPQYVLITDIRKSLKARSSGAVQNCLSKMAAQKLVFGDGKKGYRLTQKGYQEAVGCMERLPRK